MKEKSSSRVLGVDMQDPNSTYGITEVMKNIMEYVPEVSDCGRVHKKTVIFGTSEYRVQSTEYRVQSTEYRVQSTEYRVQSTEFDILTRRPRFRGDSEEGHLCKDWREVQEGKTQLSGDSASGVARPES